MTEAPTPTLADAACLALVVEAGDAGIHGWALATQLLPDTALGRIWTLSRPLAYRSLDRLVTAGLIEHAGHRPGRGPRQRAVRATMAGGALLTEWLAQPVEHLRDARTELLLKLEFSDRAGRPTTHLLAAQRALWADRLDNLATSNDDDDTVARWRREQAGAIRRFLDDAGLPRL